MYDGRFIKAKNCNGKYYRDTQTGNLVEYCMHSFYIYPKFISAIDYCAGIIPEEKKEFDGFEGICYFCGEVIHIPRENLCENDEALQKELKERLEEIEMESSQKKKRSK